MFHALSQLFCRCKVVCYFEWNIQLSCLIHTKHLSAQSGKNLGQLFVLASRFSLKRSSKFSTEFSTCKLSFFMLTYLCRFAPMLREVFQFSMFKLLKLTLVSTYVHHVGTQIIFHLYRYTYIAPIWKYSCVCSIHVHVHVLRFLPASPSTFRKGWKGSWIAPALKCFGCAKFIKLFRIINVYNNCYQTILTFASVYTHTRTSRRYWLAHQNLK